MLPLVNEYSLFLVGLVVIALVLLLTGKRFGLKWVVDQHGDRGRGPGSLSIHRQHQRQYGLQQGGTRPGAGNGQTGASGVVLKLLNRLPFGQALGR